MLGSGNYRLVRSLGAGGMAEVFEAVVQGQAGFERRVVVKRLLEELADETNHQNFVDEAKIASFLHHNNIVSVLDFGVMDGLPFQVLELVDGMSTKRLIRDFGPLSAELGLYITTEIAHALNYAHKAKSADGKPLCVVHRDVSPENILLSRFGDVKLADFGIATFSDRRVQTRVGIAKGKLLYMAPEQFRGEPVDARTDIFSLGCVLHELVLGSSPLAEQPVRKDLMAGMPVPLSPDIPSDVRAIIARAMAPKPDERFAKASAVASACAKALGTRQTGDGRSLLVEHLEQIEDETLRATPEIEKAHPLNSLMQVELVLQETTGGVRTFHTRVGPNPLNSPLNSGKSAVPEIIQSSDLRSGEVQARETEGRVKALHEVVSEDVVESRREAWGDDTEDTSSLEEDATALHDGHEAHAAHENIHGDTEIELSLSGAFVDKPSEKPGTQAVGSVEVEAAVPIDSLPGSVVGAYRILDCLGEGGFARVYRAVHMAVGNEVAVKVLLAQFDGRSPELRLEREAAALSQLEHPNLVKVFDVGALKDGRPYFAMELLFGETLNHTLMKTPKLPEERLGAIVRQVATGLAHIHQANLVHRDLSPQNIMLLPTPTGELVKILDLGIARWLDPQSGLTRLTRPGATLGTVRWMAPEQIEDPHQVTPSADLYTLGLLLHSMLNGYPTFEGIERPPPAPLERGEEFGTLIDGLLDPDPKKRPSSEEVIDALDEIIPLGTQARTVAKPATGSIPQNVKVPSVGFVESAEVGPSDNTVARMLATPSKSAKLAVYLGMPIIFICLGILGWQLSLLLTPKKTKSAPTVKEITAHPSPPSPRIEVKTPPRSPNTKRSPVRKSLPKTGPRNGLKSGSSALKQPSKRTMRAELRGLLAKRGLRFKDLLQLDETRGAAKSWREAIRSEDSQKRVEAHQRLRVSLERLNLDARFVRKRLEEVRGQLASVRSKKPKSQLAKLERRYLDIRAALSEGLSDAQCTRILIDISKLERNITGA